MLVCVEDRRYRVDCSSLVRGSSGLVGGVWIPDLIVLLGNCRFGDKCWFAHDQEVGEPESEELEDGEIQTMVEKGKQKGAVVAAKEEKVTLKEVEKVEPSACMICFDEEPKQYGLLSV